MELGTELKLKTNELNQKYMSSFENERSVTESLAVSAIKSNHEFFYAYAKNNAKIKTKIGPLIQNVNISDPKSIAVA